MVVPGATARRGGLVASHQLAEQLEQGEAQWARRHARLAALRAQHLQLDRLRARAHPRRYRRAMPRTAARGHSGVPPGEPRAANRDATCPHTSPDDNTRRVPHARLLAARSRYSCADHASALAAARATRGVAFHVSVFSAPRNTTYVFLVSIIILFK